MQTKKQWLAILLLLNGCAATAVSTKTPTDLGYNHPLRGKQWQVASQSFIDDQTLSRALENAEIVLVGEKHDNFRHHRFQAEIIEKMVSLGKRPTIVWEMIPLDRQSHVDQALNEKVSAETLGERLAWSKSGWPAWSIYQPIAAAALRYELPMIAAGISRDTLFSLTKDPQSAASQKRIAELSPADLSADARRFLAKAIVDGHCGYSNARMNQIMVLAQKLRDASMAKALIAGKHRSGSALLIAGNGHVDKRYGVFAQLRARDPTLKVISIGLVEVDDKRRDAKAYYAVSHPEFDLLRFTPRVDNDDPCEKFSRQLKSMKTHHK